MIPTPLTAARRALVAATVVFLLAAATAAGVIGALERDRLDLERARAADQASDSALNMRLGIEYALSATHALAAVVRESRGVVRDFERSARDLMTVYPNVSALQLAPGGVVRNSFPLAGNEKAIGHDLFQDPVRNRSAFLARDSGQLTLAGPFKLIQGGTGAVGRLPVFLDDDAGHPVFWGFTSVLLRLPEALKPARLDSLAKLGYQYKLWQARPGSGNREVVAESSAAPLGEPVEYEVKVADVLWTLGVAPANGWSDPFGLAVKAAFGLLLSLLLATVAKLLFDLKSHQAGLEALVDRRTREAEARAADLGRAQSIAHVGSWVWDSGAREIEWSPQAIRMIGAHDEQPPGDFRAFLKRVPAKDKDIVRGALKGVLAGASYDIEHRVNTGKEIRWIRQRSSPELAADGKVSRIAGTFQDITERKRAEEALGAAEARYRSLVEQSLAGIYIIQDGRWAYVNPRAAEIFGYDSPEELMAVDPLATAPEEDHATMREQRQKVLGGEAPSYHYTRGAIRKDGTTLVLDVTGTLSTHEGRPALIGMIQDISEMRRAEEQIQRHVAQLESAMMHTVEMAMTLGEMRDPYTAGHQRRVAETAVAIGRHMGLDAWVVEGLRVAGYLHDIGKMTIPAEILSKPSKLSDIEFSLIKGHSQSSHDVLKAVDFPWPVAQVALQHHERMDGSGYPQGLKGEAILFEARILAVADVVEAMSTHRPYRAALGVEKALAEIERGSGTSYDSAVADACLRLFQVEGFTIPG